MDQVVQLLDTIIQAATQLQDMLAGGGQAQAQQPVNINDLMAAQGQGGEQEQAK